MGYDQHACSRALGFDFAGTRLCGKVEVALLRPRAAGEKEAWKTLALWSALGASVPGLGLIPDENAPVTDRRIDSLSSSD